MLPGQAISRTGGGTLRELSERTGLPVVGMESPRGINNPSLGAFAETLAEADLLVLLGKRLDYGLKFGESPALDPDCRIVHVDHEPAALEQTRQALEGSDRLAAAVHADPVSTAAALASAATASGDGAWLEEVQSALSYVPPNWAALESPGDGPLHPAAVCRAVQDLLAGGDPVFVLDGGEFGQWSQACMSSPRLIINGPGGSIGTGIPGRDCGAAGLPRLDRRDDARRRHLRVSTGWSSTPPSDTTYRSSPSSATTPSGTPSTRFNCGSTGPQGRAAASSCRRATTCWPSRSAPTVSTSQQAAS